LQIGLKIWSINTDCASTIEQIIREKLCDYIELYIVPGTFYETHEFWRSLPVPYILHAPTTLHGLNPARAELADSNCRLYEEVEWFAADLGTETIILHPGIDGPLATSIAWLRGIARPGLLIENKPWWSLDRRVCVGATPIAIQYIMSQTGIGFCLDFGHAIKTAIALKLNALDLIDRFLELKPAIFHISDGNMLDMMDQHWSLGKGDFPFPLIFQRLLLFQPSKITVETEKEFPDFYDQFYRDIMFIRRQFTNLECNPKLSDDI